MRNNTLILYVRLKDLDLYKAYNITGAFTQYKILSNLLQDGPDTSDTLLVLINKNKSAFTVDNKQVPIISILLTDMYIAVDKNSDLDTALIDDICSNNGLKVKSYRVYNNLRKPIIDLRC